jgi:hypothetical protein
VLGRDVFREKLQGNVLEIPELHSIILNKQSILIAKAARSTKLVARCECWSVLGCFFCSRILYRVGCLLSKTLGDK